MFQIAMLAGGPWDIAIIAGVVILLFGGSKVAGLGKSLGDGIKEFKKATREDDDPPGPTAAVPATTAAPAATVKTEEK